MSEALQSVHLRVSDSATGKAVPARLRVTDEAGEYFAPLGRLASFDASAGGDLGGNVLIEGEAWAYIDGACEILLPPGTLHVRIAKGPEYAPLDTAVSLAPGKLSLRFELTRRVDLAALGWHAGDVAAYDMTPHAALLEGAGEGLAVVNLLVREHHGTLPNIVAFSGQKPILEQPGTLVAVNSRNDSPLGRLCLLHCHRTIYPLSFALDGDNVWTLDDWRQQCHRIRQRPGLVVAENFFSHDDEVSERTALLALGRIDAVLYEPGRALEPWFTLLDAGVRVPLVAGSRRECASTPLGSWRTYAHVPTDEAMTYSRWIEAVRAGHTWVTSGPLMSLEKTGERTVRAKSHGGGMLSIVAGGAMIGPRSGGEEIEANVPPDACWALARVQDAAGELRAITSPVYFETAASSPSMVAARSRLTAELQAGETWLRTSGCVSAKQQTHLLDTLREAAAQLSMPAARLELGASGLPL